MGIGRRFLVVASLLLLAAALAACGSGSSGPELTRCPKRPPGLAGGSAGPEGETVETQPRSGLICRWRAVGGAVERHEVTIVRGLSGLVAMLNGLGPPAEGEFACESGSPVTYLIALRYRESSEAEVEIGLEGCGFTRTEEHSYGSGGGVARRLDTLLDGA